MPDKPQIEYAVSAGGVVYRLCGGRLEFVVCERFQPRTWSLPKGTPDWGETLEQTALREVKEETGLDVELKKPLGSITYWFTGSSRNTKCHKTVHFYLMESIGGSTALHDIEFDQVNWYPAAEALELMTYPNEAHIVNKALAEGLV
mgnify:CR=1 FL=1